MYVYVQVGVYVNMYMSMCIKVRGSRVDPSVIQLFKKHRLGEQGEDRIYSCAFLIGNPYSTKSQKFLLTISCLLKFITTSQKIPSLCLKKCPIYFTLISI